MSESPRRFARALLLPLTALFLAAPAYADPKETHQKIVIDGKEYVLWKGWHENGKPWYQHTYRNDKKEGKHTDWNENGIKISECHWKNDYLQGACQRWWDNGKLAEKLSYDRYEYDGAYQSFYESGAKREECTYRRGKREGDYHAWHENGKEKISAKFHDGRAVGEWRHWDDTGKRIETLVLKGGHAIVEREGAAMPTGVKGFRFILSQGSGLHGFDTLKIGSSGRAVYRFMTETYKVMDKAEADFPKGTVYRQPQWWEVEFKPGTAKLQALVALLKEIDFFHLKDRYRNPNIYDGSQWSIRAQLGDDTKRIELDNEFPKPLQRLSEHVHAEILEPQEFARLAALPVDRPSGEDDFLKD